VADSRLRTAGETAVFYQPEEQAEDRWILRWEMDGKRHHTHWFGGYEGCFATYRAINGGEAVEGNLPIWRPVQRMPRPGIRRDLRFRVLHRSQFRCSYCGASGVPLHLDHVVPVAAGGDDDEANLVAACEDCNSGKSDHSLSAPPPELLRQALRRAAEWEEEAKRYQDLFRRALWAIASHRLSHGICAGKSCPGCEFLSDPEIAPLWKQTISHRRPRMRP
jgi:hypothetical protein